MIKILIPLLLILWNNASGQTKLFSAPDTSFTVEIPTNWTTQTTPQSVLVATDPALPGATWEIETFSFSSPDNVLTLDEYAKVQLENFKSKGKNANKLKSGGFDTINKNRWWVMDYTSPKGTDYLVYQTIENDKRYSIYYISKGDNFVAGLPKMHSLLETFSFKTKEIARAQPNTPAPEQLSSQAPVQQPESAPIPKLMNGLTCGNDEAVEADNIKFCGNGQVVRLNKNSLQIKTPGKTVLLNNTESESDDAVSYQFIGQTVTLKGFVVQIMGMENSSYVIINTSNGSQIFLPNLNYQSSPNGKLIATFSNDIINQADETFVAIYSVSDAGLQQVFTQKTFTAGKGWGPASIAWVDDNTVEINKEVILNAATEQTKPAGKTWLQLAGDEWQWKTTKPSTKAQMTLARSAEEYPELPYGETKEPHRVKPAGDVQHDVLPIVRMKEAKPVASADALARAVLNAVKTNNKQAYFDLVAKGTLEEAEKALIKIRKKLEAAGVADWNKIQYSRVEFSPNRNKYIKDEEVHDFVNIEFTYGKDFIGAVRGHLNSGKIVIKDGKYLLYMVLDDGGMFRRESYRPH
ncbi:hypothetical protein [Parafilimonas sp.]|uniref:hypothetical protein n=1 Tax=Parafilimonas sp. TaxID=1969739 RepID=UPI003F8155BB